MSDNGAAPPVKPPPDAGLLTPNDYRRLRVALDGRDPTEMLGGDTEDTMQAMILAMLLRSDSETTWEQAGDIPAGEVFDMSGGGDREPDPQTAPGGSPGPAAAPSADTGSNVKRRSAAPAPS
jgi:hypothetical protein